MKFQVNNLTLHIKELEKEEQKQTKASGIIKIKTRTEWNKEQKDYTKNNTTESWFFKINKTDKPLGRLTMGKKEKKLI